MLEFQTVIRQQVFSKRTWSNFVFVRAFDARNYSTNWVFYGMRDLAAESIGILFTVFPYSQNSHLPCSFLPTEQLKTHWLILFESANGLAVKKVNQYPKSFVLESENFSVRLVFDGNFCWNMSKLWKIFAKLFILVVRFVDGRKNSTKVMGTIGFGLNL